MKASRQPVVQGRRAWQASRTRPKGAGGAWHWYGRTHTPAATLASVQATGRAQPGVMESRGGQEEGGSERIRESRELPAEPQGSRASVDGSGSVVGSKRQPDTTATVCVNARRARGASKAGGGVGQKEQASIDGRRGRRWIT